MSTVLIIDDEPGIRLVLELALGSAGHDVVSAADGPSARRAAAEQPIDLVLVDVHLDGECGLALLDELRRLQPGVPALAMTGAWPDPDLDVAVLPKPFSIPDLLAAVDRAELAPSR